MALAKVLSRAQQGLSATLITIEAHISHGMPGFTLVGLPETTVRESRSRVRSAIVNSGFTFPAKKITLSLAPADIPKEGARYDLPIALAILLASGQLSVPKIRSFEFLGELSLDGTLRGTRGMVSAISTALECQHQIVVPAENSCYSGLFAQNSVFYAENLYQVCLFLQNKVTITEQKYDQPETIISNYHDMQDVIGQHHGRRALEIAAAGGHSLLLTGPPGVGKTMLATRLLGILPALTLEESIEVAQIYNLLSPTCHQPIRPFRAPHHSSTITALIGSSKPRSLGEVSLAHQGVLFLDELTEFERKTLDALRGPMETGQVCISRTQMKISYPANFQLIAAMNTPFDKQSYSSSHRGAQHRHLNRFIEFLSGPLFDRFQLSIELTLASKPRNEELDTPREDSNVIRQRVIASREKQLLRQGKINALLSSSEVQCYCALSARDVVWLTESCKVLQISHRVWFNTLKVARTIADLNGEQHITRVALKEALSYRNIERIIHYVNQRYQ